MMPVFPDDSGMRIGEKMLSAAERKLGGLAFPGILRWVAGFQLLGFLLMFVSEGFAQAIIFDKEKILSGEVWRIISWLFLPMGTSFLFLITVLFMFFLNDLIENAIGTFRLNVYVVAMAICITLPALSPISNPIFTAVMPMIFFSAMIFAAASFFPDHTILLMLIIPVKMKWLAWIDAALLFGSLLMSPIPYITIPMVLFALFPYIVGIFPSIAKQHADAARASARRAKFQRHSTADGAFHTCHNCGITDTADPHMEFRVSSEDGNEYCLPCREKLK